MKHSSQQGFTLLEILVAVSIFALSVLAFVQSRTVSLRNVVSSEKLSTALQLGQAKMTEMELKFQQQVDRNGLATSFTKENGTFDAPHEAYSWTAELKENELKLSPEEFVKILVSIGFEKEEAEAQVDDPQQALLLTNLNKTMKENFAELKVEIIWDQFGRKMKMPLVTHLIPEKPKIELQMTAEK